MDETPGRDADGLDIARALVNAQPSNGEVGVLAWLTRLCLATVQALPVAGASVCVMTEDEVQTVAASSDPFSRWLVEMQFTLGEGPSVDAFGTRRPVLEGALDDGALARWPGYAPLAHARGVRAAFAMPLQVGAARLGVLDCHTSTAGVLPGAAVRQALSFAELAVHALLDGQASSALEGAHGELDGSLGGFAAAIDYGHVVYQAQGMAMVDLGIPLRDAMVRLRAYAFAVDRPLAEVAADVVAGRLRLQRDERP